MDTVLLQCLDDPPGESDRVLRWPAQVQALEDQKSILLLMDNYPDIGKYSLLCHDACGYLTEYCPSDTVTPPPVDTLWPDPDGVVITYPNPSSGHWNLVWDVNRGDSSMIRVYDVAGREMLQRDLVREDKPNFLDLDELAQGVYILEITSAQGGRFRSRLVLSR
ncbi:MAG: T9SS type A sorting domain-containing protein [Bacteroidia bacterium]